MGLAWWPPYPAVAIGQILPNAAGWFAVTFDQTEDETVALNATASGNCEAQANGRVSPDPGYQPQYERLHWPAGQTCLSRL